MASLEISVIAGRLRGVLGGALAPRIVEVLLVILLGALLAIGLVKLLAPLPLPKGDVMASITAQSSNSGEAEVARSPFPKAEIVVEPAEAAPDLAETALDLTLTGVWPGEEVASAIIRKPGGKQETFGLGDTIVNGVTLVAVFSDQVIIEQNGVRESLRFESKARVTRSEPVEATPPPSRGVSIGDIHSLFRLGPGEDANGRPAVAIFAGSDRAKFQQTGLQDGDVLKAINGAPPPLEPASLAKLMNDIALSGKADVVVERGGEVRSFSLSFSELGNE